MNDQQIYTKKFTEKALENGFSSDYIKKCLNYAKPILANNLPVIYNIDHFSNLVGYNVSYLKRAVKFQKFFYRKFEIDKRNGKKRILNEPLPSLKEIQLWILNEILYKNKVSRYAKAYVPNRSIKEHTIYHTDEKFVLTLDIKEFFKNIKFEFVESLFKSMGYSRKVSNLLTKLCYLEKELPQGASTSPYISNLILKDFDNVISNYCISNKIKYTRYADDLAFSGNLNTDEIGILVNKELSKIGLELNDEKTKLMKPNQPQLISGIIVNKKAQLPKKIRNSLRNDMFFIKKFGLVNHMERTNQTKSNYLKHLIGRINYVLQINPRDKEFIEYRKYLYDLK
ncbi:RNA-directed DNA polymerase [Bizionia argentinensis JUB59]|uniref:RNA-directed DNA polymerase n=1 Tax=Bizionia argentinensis JUB59 TaxID=1046627 RepID=G2EG93_9FLAO|nr:reverse transcriptase family protein [Bizionia argentinensis]EGV42537.1 RNA-directed DNA polymerase [Bizionia argentinensis JUB59]